VSFLGRPVVSNTVLVFIGFGFWAVAFSALVVTLPPTMHYKGPGKGAEFWIAVSLLTFTVQQPSL
jgi:hypothetical protein